MGLSADPTRSAQNGGAGESPARSIWGIIIDVFTSPTRAFSDYKRKPTIIVPIILTIALAAISGAVMAPYQARLQIELLGQSDRLPAEVMERARQDAENPNNIKGAISGGIIGLFPALLVALLAWGIGTFFFGGTARFKALWGTCLLGGLIPLVVNAIIKLPLIVAKGDSNISFGLAALMPPKYTSVLYLLLSYVDAITVWSLIITGIGIGVHMGISRAKGISTAVIAIAILVFGGLGLQIIGLSFAGIKTSLL